MWRRKKPSVADHCALSGWICLSVSLDRSSQKGQAESAHLLIGVLRRRRRFWHPFHKEKKETAPISDSSSGNTNWRSYKSTCELPADHLVCFDPSIEWHLSYLGLHRVGTKISLSPFSNLPSFSHLKRIRSRCLLTELTLPRLEKILAGKWTWQEGVNEPDRPKESNTNNGQHVFSSLCVPFADPGPGPSSGPSDVG